MGKIPVAATAVSSQRSPLCPSVGHQHWVDAAEDSVSLRVPLPIAAASAAWHSERSPCRLGPGVELEFPLCYPSLDGVGRAVVGRSGCPERELML